MDMFRKRAAIALGVIALVLAGCEGGGNTPSANLDPAGLEEPIAASDAGIGELGERTVQPGAAGGPPKVIVHATDEAWIRVRDGDAVIFEGTLPAGGRFELPERMIEPLLRAGNAGAVYVLVDGATYGPLGRPRRMVKNVSLRAADIESRFSPASAGNTQAMANISLVGSPNATAVGPLDPQQSTAEAAVDDRVIIAAFRASKCGAAAPNFERLMRWHVGNGLRVPDGITLYDAGIGNYASKRCGEGAQVRAIGAYASKRGTYQLRFFGGKVTRTLKVR